MLSGERIARGVEFKQPELCEVVKSETSILIKQLRRTPHTDDCILYWCVCVCVSVFPSSMSQKTKGVFSWERDRKREWKEMRGSRRNVK